MLSVVTAGYTALSVYVTISVHVEVLSSYLQLTLFVFLLLASTVRLLRVTLELSLFIYFRHGR